MERMIKILPIVLMMLVVNVQSMEKTASVLDALAQDIPLCRAKKMALYQFDCQRWQENVKIHYPAIALRCMTYNVHFWQDAQGKNNMTNVIGIIKKVNPDIICLQEVFWTGEHAQVFTRAMRQLGYLYGGSDTFIDCKKDFGNIIFSKYPLHNIVKKWYKEPSHRDDNEWRGFTAATVVFQGIPVRFYCTHLDVWDDSEQTRKSEIEELTAFIQKYDMEQQDIFIVGDFNALFSKHYQEKIRDRKLWDLLVADDKARKIETQTSVEQPLNKAGYTDIYTMLNILPPFTVWSGRIVDQIVKKPGGLCTVADVNVYYNAASDHLPVYFDIVSASKKSKL